MSSHHTGTDASAACLYLAGVAQMHCTPCGQNRKCTTHATLDLSPTLQIAGSVCVCMCLYVWVGSGGATRRRLASNCKLNIPTRGEKRRVGGGAQKTGTFFRPVPVHLAVLTVAVATGHNERSWQQTLKVFFLFIFFCPSHLLSTLQAFLSQELQIKAT